jgi:hypothetical protein
MKSHNIAIAFAGLASTTHAETFSLTMAAPDLVGGLTSIFEVEVFADATLGTHILGGAYSLQSYSPDIIFNAMGSC